MNAKATLEPLDILFAQKTLLLFPGLSSAARTIGGAILDHFNKRTGQCDPGIDRLGKLTGLSRRAVIRAIDELGSETVGLFHRARHGGKSHRNAYTPNFDAFRLFVTAWDERMRTGACSDITAKYARKSKSKKSKKADERCQKRHLEQCQKEHLGSVRNGTQTLLINPSKKTRRNTPDLKTLPSTPEQADKTNGLWKEGNRRNRQSLPTQVKPSGKDTSAANASRNAAHKRISEHFRSSNGFEAWKRFCELATDGNPTYEQAVSAETRKRGAGVAIMRNHLLNIELGRQTHGC
jgi:hypothetical protein